MDATAHVVVDETCLRLRMLRRRRLPTRGTGLLAPARGTGLRTPAHGIGPRTPLRTPSQSHRHLRRTQTSTQ